MTKWQEVADLELDDERDEFDPVAAPIGGFGGELEAEPEDEFESRGPWKFEDGFPDHIGVVRVWVDETKLITRVRLSPSWREKLGKRPLALPFAQAFALINTYADEHSVKVPSLLAVDPTREARNPFSWEALDRIVKESERVARDLEALEGQGSGRLRGAESVGESPDKLVAIRVGLEGELAGIEFNPRKLAESRVRQVTDAVVRAHAAARARWRPPTYEEGRRDQLQNQLAELRNETLAMMRRGFK